MSSQASPTASDDLPSVFFCAICDKPTPSVGAARAHVTTTDDDVHRDHSGHDSAVIVDAAGDPVDPPEEQTGEGRGGVERRTTARRDALRQYIEERGGYAHVINHHEQADRFGVALDTITTDLKHLRESGAIERADWPAYRCGFCDESYASVRAVKTHASKKSDDAHRGHTGSDPGAIQRPTEESQP